jgi:hypothetical protein
LTFNEYGSVVFFVCFRATPDKIGIEKVAAQLKKLNIHGLLVIGGFEVWQTENTMLFYVFMLYSAILVASLMKVCH